MTWVFLNGHATLNNCRIDMEFAKLVTGDITIDFKKESTCYIEDPPSRARMVIYITGPRVLMKQVIPTHFSGGLQRYSVTLFRC